MRIVDLDWLLRKTRKCPFYKELKEILDKDKEHIHEVEYNSEDDTYDVLHTVYKMTEEEREKERKRAKRAEKRRLAEEKKRPDYMWIENYRTKEYPKELFGFMDNPEWVDG